MSMLLATIDQFLKNRDLDDNILEVSTDMGKWDDKNPSKSESQFFKLVDFLREKPVNRGATITTEKFTYTAGSAGWAKAKNA